MQSLPQFMENSKWIWSDRWSYEDKESPGVMLFRRVITLDDKVVRGEFVISADTRYKLYINGELICMGPSRGDDQVWFYDTLDVTDRLVVGDNCIGVTVLRYPEDPAKGNHSMFRTSVPGLYFKGCLEMAGGEIISLSADQSWTCHKDNRVTFVREEERFAPLIIHEKTYGDPRFLGWKKADYDDSRWWPARPYSKIQVHGAVSPGNLSPRRIPYLYRKPRKFAGVMCVRMSEFEKADWESFLRGEREMVIPPYSEEIIEIDAGEEMTGHVKSVFNGGAGARISYLYSEAYVQNGFVGPEKIPVKEDRCDWKNGHLAGYKDRYYLHGQGNEKDPETYIPFWFRTFRFIRIHIRTGEAPLIFKRYDYAETGYPLEVKSRVTTSDKSLEKIWEISERTLRRCMHETYEDCPFYEQLQYIMDSRQQILYTYAVSGDDRLARQCIDAMGRAQRYDGLMNCSYPNCNTNVIPGFSIYYILMVHDHMMYFGDRELVRNCMPVIERVLYFFKTHKTPEGYVDKVGGSLMNAPFWSFIDWAAEWNDYGGMPTAGLCGPLTMESLLYIYGLQKAAELAEYIKRYEDAKMYLEEAAGVQRALLTHCMGQRGMLTDGPGVEEYSQHCQVFAVLTRTGENKALKANLLRTIVEPGYPQSTVAMRFYLFRALELTGLYEYTDQYWEAWRNMIRMNCTTCVESEAYSRSECHAWGSLILHELPAVTLGVRPAAPGCEKVYIRPVAGYMTHAAGDVITPRGMVHVEWKVEDGRMQLSYQAPEGMDVVL